MKILVTYATAHGSTPGIAERIASRLRALTPDARLEVGPVERASPPADHDAVVVGSPIHDQAWLPAAQRFVREHEAALASRPVWLFSVGMPAALPRRLQTWAATEEPKVIDALGVSLHPRGTRLFSGVVRKEQLSGRGRLQFRLMGGRYGDFRDWEAIDAWAEEIARDLAALARPTGPS